MGGGKIEPPLLNPKGFNHRNWGKTFLMVVEAQGIELIVGVISFLGREDCIEVNDVGLRGNSM